MKIIIDISVKEILALFGIQGEIDKKEATRLRKNANNQRYRERNRELVNTRKKLYREKNREKIRARRKAYDEKKREERTRWT